MDFSVDALPVLRCSSYSFMHCMSHSHPKFPPKNVQCGVSTRHRSSSDTREYLCGQRTPVVEEEILSWFKHYPVSEQP